VQSALEDVNDAAQNPTIINARHSAYIIRQQRLDLLKLLLAEPEQVTHQDLYGKILSPNHKGTPL
jgi:hypothetical protein